jgi:hypothetical protein
MEAVLIYFLLTAAFAAVFLILFFGSLKID